MEISNTLPSELKPFTVSGYLFPNKKVKYEVLSIPKNYSQDNYRSR
jgi:hypothetical protein